MLKASELRIGNYISFCQNAYKVSTEIRMYNYENKIFWSIDGYNINLFKPIILTKEYLVKFGFKKNHKITLYNEYEMSLDNGVYIYFGFNGGKIYFYLEGVKIEIKYVHQLQNLYFSLTGEELQIIKKEYNHPSSK